MDLTHISGMISQINPYEYIINALRRRKNRQPNGTKEEALELLFKCMQEIGPLDGFKECHICS